MKNHSTRWALLASAMCLASAVSTAGCQPGPPAPSDATPSAGSWVYPDIPANAGVATDYVYNPTGGTLETFDVGRNAVVATSDATSFVVYGFSSAETVFTAGNTQYPAFSLFEINGSTAVEKLRLPTNEGLFPLAATDSQLYFTLERYNDRSAVASRALVCIDRATWAMKEYPNFSKRIMSGAIIGSLLYFTQTNGKGAINLSSVPLDDLTATPTLVRSGLSYPDIYASGNLLLTRVSDTQVSGEGVTINCPYACVFPRHVDAVISMYPDATHTMVARVYRGSTGAKLDGCTDAIGVGQHGGHLAFYCGGSVHEVKAPA